MNVFRCHPGTLHIMTSHDCSNISRAVIGWTTDIFHHPSYHMLMEHLASRPVSGPSTIP